MINQEPREPKLRFRAFDDEWSKSKIKELAKVSSGATPLRSTKAYFEDGDTVWIKTTDLRNAPIGDSEEKVTSFALDDTSLKIFPIGTVLVAMYGGFRQIGRTGMLTVPAATNQALFPVFC